ncbi:MAG TPA: threonine synthase [Gemmatimonadaceae bacterium]|nr:threonine synthase [Gemmatimonadaceae bacterium]
MNSWTLECSACGHAEAGSTRATVCPSCGQPYLVRYAELPASRDVLRNRWDMWRYAALLPLCDGETPVSLGEGATPLLESRELSRELGVARFWIKDEGLNPTGSFKARGMSAAVTRAKALGVPGLVVPTAGNAGAALAAYAAAAGMAVRVYAPETTPRGILATIRTLGADLHTVPGHIGDAGAKAKAFAAESGYFDVSTLREPYRIEGKKTMGLELAEQLGWRLPTVIVYPTGGGTGLIGMWKGFAELREMGWLDPAARLPRMVTAQAEGCAPIVRAFAEHADRARPWENPVTHASGLRVPGPLGDRLILRALYESNGAAVAVSEAAIREGTARIARTTGIDAAPEGGCAFAVCQALAAAGQISAADEVVVYNTGSGVAYRE